MVTVNPEKKVDKGKAKMVINSISHDQVEKSLNEGSTYYAFVAREAELETESHILGHIRPILEEFFEVLYKNLPGELPPMRNIQYVIDLVTGATLPNMSHYMMNRAEHAK